MLATRYADLPGAQIAYSIVGNGPPLLLLHGFPETHAAWLQAAPLLAPAFTLVMPDLLGYGDSTITADGGDERYSKQNMARLLAAFMEQLGYPAFFIAGHDRGGRVALRMCLDFPNRIWKAAMLDIIPAADIADRIDFSLAGSLANWWFMGQPHPLPETILTVSHDFYLEYILNQWSGGKSFILPAARDEYFRCFRKRVVIDAVCAEYRAGNALDLQAERESRKSGQRIQCSLLVLWSDDGFVTSFGDPLHIWRQWCGDVTGHQLSASHFLMEEQPTAIASNFLSFFLASTK
ncbi:alpha/beta hydrolase [Mucilaginibacter sp. R-33]|uniref:alpha/beta hydrolase n=1 Tax=Mucilaginibacter sp. R-33 TaxID=3416711 RepID=UPI003CF093D3